MKMLVLATAHGGAKQMCNMLQSAGYDVNLNAYGKNGIVKQVPSEKIFYVGDIKRVYVVVANPLPIISLLRVDATVKKEKLKWAIDTWEFNQRQLMREATSMALPQGVTPQYIRIEKLREDWPKELFKPKNFSRYKAPACKLKMADIESRVYLLEYMIRFGYDRESK